MDIVAIQQAAAAAKKLFAPLTKALQYVDNGGDTFTLSGDAVVVNPDGSIDFDVDHAITGVSPAYVTAALGQVVGQIANAFTPEMYPASADDGAAINSAFQAAGAIGGAVAFQYGKTYYVPASRSFDFSTLQPITVLMDGATIVFTGTGGPGSYAMRVHSTATPAVSARSLTAFGGEFVDGTSGHTLDRFWLLQDVQAARFYRPRANTPGGAGFHLDNSAYWTERTVIEDFDDHLCREAVRIGVSNSSYDSFKGTTIRNLYLQGGTSGYAKINILDGVVPPSVRDSLIDGVFGDIADGVVGLRLTGAMRGTHIRGLGIEGVVGATTAAYFQFGAGDGTNPFTGAGPIFDDGPPPTTSNRMILNAGTLPSPSPFGSKWSAGGLKSYGALSINKRPFNLTTDGVISFDVRQGNAFQVNLSANLTAMTLNNPPTADEGMPGQPAQTITIHLVQDATGGRTYAWPANVKWLNGPPTDTTANRVITATLMWNGGGFWWEIAPRAVGTTAGTIAAGDDSRITGAAPLASPAFTGNPTVPTPAPGDNSTKAASTAFVAAAIGTPLVAIRTTDAAAINNNAVVATSTVLTLAVEANATYLFESLIHYDASTAADLKIAFAVPAGATGYWTPDGLQTTASATGGSIQRARVDLATSQAVGGVGVGTTVTARPSGHITTGSTAGSFAFRFAQSVADPTDLVIRSGSLFTARRIA